MIMLTVFQTNIVYRFNIITKIISSMLVIYVLRQLWEKIYESSDSFSSSLSIADMLNYVTISVMIGAIYGSTIIWEFSQKVRTGTIVFEFQKPWNLTLSLLSNLLGRVLSDCLVVNLPILLLSFFFFPISIGASIFRWIGFAMLVMLGFLIHFFVQLFITSLSIVFVEIWGVQMVYGLAALLLGGKIIPLTFFPEFLQPLLSVLPFRSFYDIPISFLIRESAHPFLFLVLFDLIWIMALWLMSGSALFLLRKRLMLVGG